MRRGFSTRRKLGVGAVLVMLAFTALAEGGFYQKVRESVGEWTGLLNARAPASPQTLNAQGSITVAFSPKGGATQAVVDAIRSAKERIWVQAYSFTSAPIAQALVQAHGRGVKVIAVLDKSQRTANYSEADYLANHAVPTYIDDQHAIAHNKIMVIDGDTLITGSFNFTKAGEKSNAENLLIFRGNPALVDLYAQNFQHHRAHSTEFRNRRGYD